MSLPPLTSLQFLVVNLLFSGPKSGAELRHLLEGIKIKISPSALTRLMTRLEWMHQIKRRYVMHKTAVRNIRRCTFAVTDYGVSLWKETREFYLELSPPPPEFVPVSTEGSRIAHLSPAARNDVMFRRMVGGKG